jgi:hypothetical protein
LSATPIAEGVETEPRAITRVHDQAESPIAAETAGSAFVDLFSGPFGSDSPASPPIRRTGRERRERAGAVRQAVAAATVALCAAALSVAVWAASAAHAVSGQNATTESNATAADASDQADGPATIAIDGSIPSPAPAAGLNPGQPDTTLPVPESWHVRLTAALALGEADDIESLEQAVSILRQLEKEAPQAAASEDLSDRIEALERKVDDLTIRKFLRKDS